MSSTPMDIDTPASSAAQKPTVPPIAKLTTTISTFRPVRHWEREHHHKTTSILSLDFDDRGEQLITSESDQTLELYTVMDGKFNKRIDSKKYGAKLAKFTHNSASVLYASTEINDDIRYLSTHNDTFLGYFRGHGAAVTSITMHPSSDLFLSTSLDNTLRIWDLKSDPKSDKATGILHLTQPTLSAFDASATVFAVASPTAQTLLLYDYRNHKEPFGCWDMSERAMEVGGEGALTRNWTKLQFSNDGRSILLGTGSGGHLVLDAFNGSVKHFLRTQSPGPNRLAPGQTPPEGNKDEKVSRHDKVQETSGDCCFTPDGRYVLAANGRSGANLYDVADKKSDGEEGKVRDPIQILETGAASGKSGCDIVEFNPRWQMFAAAGKSLEFFQPDRDVL